jgi:hypothetical protein
MSWDQLIAGYGKTEGRQEYFGLADKLVEFFHGIP